MDDDLGLSDREKELKKWNRPYVYREFPKMLYRGTTTTAGRFTLEERIVGSDGEQTLAADAGWVPHPERARTAETARQEAPGIAAAERAYRDRVLSAGAQAEAARVEADAPGHLPEVPEAPRRSHRTRPESGR